MNDNPPKWPEFYAHCKEQYEESIMPFITALYALHNVDAIIEDEPLVLKGPLLTVTIEITKKEDVKS